MDKPLSELDVLLVDDNAHNNYLLTEILQSLGVRSVTKASDGISGYEILCTRNIDLVICDWKMKPVDGVKFSQRVRRSPDSPCPCVPIIMLTGHADIERVVEARDAGCNDFLAKPVSPATLLARITAILETPREFVRTLDYFGPDRRRRDGVREGEDRRQPPPVTVSVAGATTALQPRSPANAKKKNNRTIPKNKA
ncbi:MAG: response regulator [Alphaproteobacteria bacterium]